ncbi:hypothetical protein J437_LFUL016390 [Ladona fulva]|uniref:Uncharacterized protein n=1 Tax=Ladona fulva TaxID=123851 RepID=A0A8K0KN80_LADFU|nr:hypothetical protein J437_LFUL016390 [Ladona fulva]
MASDFTRFRNSDRKLFSLVKISRGIEIEYKAGPSEYRYRREVHLPVPHNEGLPVPECALQVTGSDPTSSESEGSEDVNEYGLQSYGHSYLIKRFCSRSKTFETAR